MEIKQFQLDHIGRFESLEVPLAPTEKVSSNVTIFIGNNGSGKTSILKSLATSLSWFVARIKAEKGRGSPIPEDVIHAEHTSAAISVVIQDECGQANNPNCDSDINDFSYKWIIAKTKKGRTSKFSSQLQGATELAQHYRHLLSEKSNTNLPLIAFYPVERAVLDIPLKIRGKHSFLQIDGYDNSLNQGVDFRRFFEWFREREDSENESGISQEVLENLANIMGEKHHLWKELETLNASSKDRQLTAVRSAIRCFMPDFENLRVRRKPKLHMSIDKKGKTFNVLQLSQGEKSLIALVGDIARRLSMMNPGLENPLEGDGVIMIDEVDMHLHPTWQRTIIQRLTNTFPNCQFVLTTHSPLVISDTKDILVYSLDEQLNVVPSQFGQDVNSVLLGVMDTNIRNEAIETKLNDLLDLIQSRDLIKAKAFISELEQELPLDNLELSKAKLLLRREELRSAKN